MELNIKINMDNAAFEESNEISRILKGIAALFETSVNTDKTNIRDANGNTVGYFEVVEA